MSAQPQGHASDPHGSLNDQGWVLLPNVLFKDEAQSLRHFYETACQGFLPQPPLLKLNDDTGDVCNKRYASTRSPGLAYAFVRAPVVLTITGKLHGRLAGLTGIPWPLSMGQDCLTYFEYGEGAAIKAHRGRDMGWGANRYVGVGMVTDPSQDYAGGEFYLNPKAGASENGKTVWNDEPEDRIVIQIPYRAVLVFDNARFVHGTLPVRPHPDTGKSYRLVVSVRNNEESP